MRASFFAACGLVALSALGAIASCSSDCGVRETNQEDADADADATASADDAQAFDAGVPTRAYRQRSARQRVVRRRAAPGGLRLAPCATSLVTTLRGATTPTRRGILRAARRRQGGVLGANGAGQLGRGRAGTPTVLPPRASSGSRTSPSSTTRARSTGAEASGAGARGPFSVTTRARCTTERTPLKLALPPAKSVGWGSTSHVRPSMTASCAGGANSLRSRRSTRRLAPRCSLHGDRSVPPGAPIPTSSSATPLSSFAKTVRP